MASNKMNLKSKILTLITSLVIIKFLSLVFHSDASWKFQSGQFNYNDHTELINNVIAFNNLVNDKSLRGRKQLAFGNSQIRSVFKTYRNTPESEFAWTYIAAFRLCALPYYTEYLIKAQPESVVLYMTDRDFNHSTVFHSLLHQPISEVRYLQQLKNILPLTEHSRSELATIFFGELFFPLKFSYQLKHLVEDHFFEKNIIRSLSGKHVKSDFHQRENKDIYEGLDKVTINGIKSLLNLRDMDKHQERFNYNYSLFIEFIETMIENNIKVIIIEGQYHPVAYNHKKFRKQDPHAILNAIADQYEEVIVLPIENQLMLREDEYVDHVHFTHDGGIRIMNKILEELKSF